MEGGLRKSIPFLSWMAATRLALCRPECVRITASIAISISMDIPISSNALPIDPYLTLPHTTHVQSQGLFSFWCIKICLRVQVTDQLLFWRNLRKPPTLWNGVKKKQKSLCQNLLPCPHTLYHVSGCCFSATKYPFIQSTDEIEFGEPKFMASPLSPTCIKIHLWGRHPANNGKASKYEGVQFLYLVWPFLPRQVPLSLV